MWLTCVLFAAVSMLALSESILCSPDTHFCILTLFLVTHTALTGI